MHHPKEAVIDGVKFVLVKEDELTELENRSDKLRALENAGVDNWEWYDDAMSTLNEGETE